MDFVQQIVVESRHIASGAAGKDDDFVRGRNTGGSEVEPAVARRSGARRKILGRPKGTDLYVVLMQLHPDMANIEVDLSVFGDGFVKMSPQHHDGVAGIVGIFPALQPTRNRPPADRRLQADFLHIQGGFAVARPPELICQHQRNRNKRHCQQRPHQDCQFAFHDLSPATH